MASAVRALEAGPFAIATTAVTNSCRCLVDSGKESFLKSYFCFPVASVLPSDGGNKIMVIDDR